MKKGYTLIEILVVATIIGLLAAGAAASFTSLNKSARDARRKGDLEQVRSALEQYRSANSTYPTTLTLSCAVASLTDASGNIYLSKIPTDPRCVTYTYYLTASASDYTLGAYLEGGSSSSCGNCGGSQVCNYCLGPYGQK